MTKVVIVHEQMQMQTQEVEDARSDLDVDDDPSSLQVSPHVYA